MDGLLSSLIVVGLASVGDRIQLRAVLLMARWARPGSVIAGLIVATISAQGQSAFGGVLIAGHLPPRLVLLLLAIGFLSMGIWSFFPERLPRRRWRWRHGSTPGRWSLCCLADRLRV